MLRPLHIEMTFMSAIGNWLGGSGWTDEFTKANINTPGHIESFLVGSKVKRTRYAYQLSLVNRSACGTTSLEGLRFINFSCEVISRAIV